MPDRFFPLARGYVITSPYGWRDLDGQREFHAGTDFGFDGGSGGKPVYAVQAGTVIYAGAASGFGGPDPAGWVVIDSDDSQGGGVFIYGHVVREVAVGDRVVAGQRIAMINSDSRTNGGVAPHLHLAHCTFAYSDTDRDDPMPYLQGAKYPGEGTPSGFTFFSDVSEFQDFVDDRYPYRILTIRSNDGDYRDRKFQENYARAVRMFDSGKLDVLGVYFYWRPNWQTCVDVHRSMIGNPHPRIFSMIDVESGYGNENLGDQSTALNQTYDALARWLGNPKRVLAYANRNDFTTMWRSRPSGLRVIGAGYPDDPRLPGQIAHQYTNGVITGGGPLGAAPFGNCDMNKTPLSVADFAAAVGVSIPPPTGGGGDGGEPTSGSLWDKLGDLWRYVRDHLNTLIPTR
ncbi:MAG: M23 family metallopeptidase [Nocardiaceae bacterium]|nr:M23 family metallopeptidase [Nocardiaceae bacterium]